jgi:hypothetical protein
MLDQLNAQSTRTPAFRYKGRLGTYLDPIGRQVVFDATATHERDGPDRFLADFRGTLRADAYRGSVTNARLTSSGSPCRRPVQMETASTEQMRRLRR